MVEEITKTSLVATFGLLATAAAGYAIHRFRAPHYWYGAAAAPLAGGIVWAAVRGSQKSAPVVAPVLAEPEECTLGDLNGLLKAKKWPAYAAWLKAEVTDYDQKDGVRVLFGYVKRAAEMDQPADADLEKIVELLGLYRKPRLEALGLSVEVAYTDGKLTFDGNSITDGLLSYPEVEVACRNACLASLTARFNEAADPLKSEWQATVKQRTDVDFLKLSAGLLVGTAPNGRVELMALRLADDFGGVFAQPELEVETTAELMAAVINATANEWATNLDRVEAFRGKATAFRDKVSALQGDLAAELTASFTDGDDADKMVAQMHFFRALVRLSPTTARKIEMVQARLALAGVEAEVSKKGADVGGSLRTLKELLEEAI